MARRLTLRASAWLLAGMLPASALAVTTTAFDLSGNEPFEKGRFEGAALRSDGRLVRAPKAVPIDLEGAAVGYASATSADGRIFVATGNEGRVFVVEGDAAKPFAKLDLAVVTSLVSTKSGLFAAGMPGGKVFRIDADGKAEPFASLEGVQEVWALAYDEKRSVLWAGTGPEGRLYAIDAAGKPGLRLDVDAEHVLSLALAENGSVYAGTSDGALLYRVKGRDSSVVFDFPGEELGALSVRAGRIAAVANSFPKLPKAPAKVSAATKPPKLKAGSGELWLIHEDGHGEALLEEKESHLSAVEFAGDGSVFVAVAERGRVLRVSEDGEHGVWAEVEGRKVMALALESKQPHFVASDGAALVRLKSDDGPGHWLSAALDAETRARFGELTPRFSGNVQWQTRSGNTEDPGEGWSAWSRPTRGAGPVRSPAARYLQVRVSLSGDDAELRSIEALYLPSNRLSRSRNVRVKDPKKPKDEDYVDGVYRVPSELELEWDTDNPDDDRLLYSVEVAGDGSDAFLSLLAPGEELHEAKFTWDTSHVPDGLYHVRVGTSDAPSNPAPYALQSSVTSPLIRVDNHAPRLRLERKGSKLTGKAEDDTSRIAALTLSVDGGPFWPIAPADDLLDQREESFEHTLTELPRGAHTVAVRATDAAGNARIEQLRFDVR